MAAAAQREQRVHQRPVSQLGRDDGIQRGGHHSPDFPADEPARRGREVVPFRLLGHCQPQRVGEQRYHRAALLGRRALVGRVVRGRGIVWDVEPGRHPRPAAIRVSAEPAARGDGDFEVLPRHRIGVRVVSDADEAFIDRNDVADVVAPRHGVQGRAAHPEIRGLPDHGITGAREPRGVPSREVILPLSERHVARDVDLRQGVLPGELRCRFLAQLIRLPGIHRAPVAVSVGVAPCRGERAGAERDHRARDVGMQEQQRREHPRVRVPEDVPVVSRARQAHRSDALTCPLADARQEIEQHRMDDALQLGIALHHHVRLPQAMPRRDVLGEERPVATGGGTADRGSRRRQWVRPIPRRRDADELRERDGLAGRRIEGDLRGALLHVPEPPRRRHRLCHGDPGRPTFRSRGE